MSRLTKFTACGLDLAAVETNLSGFAVIRGKTVHACQLHSLNEALKTVVAAKPRIVAVDAPLSLPKQGTMRAADRAMNSRGYRVFPPLLPAMKKLAERAIKLKTMLEQNRLPVIEVHPTSSRKALQLPAKDWRKIQDALRQMSFEGDPATRTLSPHEIDAVTAALTGCLHLKNGTELIGDAAEGYIVVPKRQSWRQLKI